MAEDRAKQGQNNRQLKIYISNTSYPPLKVLKPGFALYPFALQCAIRRLGLEPLQALVLERVFMLYYSGRGTPPDVEHIALASFMDTQNAREICDKLVEKGYLIRRDSMCYQPSARSEEHLIETAKHMRYCYSRIELTLTRYPRSK